MGGYGSLESCGDEAKLVVERGLQEFEIVGVTALGIGGVEERPTDIALGVGGGRSCQLNVDGAKANDFDRFLKHRAEPGRVGEVNQFLDVA